LSHFLRKNKEENPKLTQIKSYSDNCGGQNKNQYFGAAVNLIAARTGLEITHTYLERGHTYNAADTYHSMIERRSRSVNLYTPAEWYDLMGKTSRNKKKQIEVVQVTQDHIYDFHELAEKRLNVKKNTDGEAVPWSEIRQLIASPLRSNELGYRTEFKGPIKTICLNRVGRPVNALTYPLPRAYTIAPSCSN